MLFRSFVSYYDYYQPEAYVPASDTYIEKDSSINDNIDKLRHAATHALLTRRDVIIVASVSCIYGLGSPEYYAKMVIPVEVGQHFPMDKLITRLAGSLNKSFVLEKFCEQEQCSERALRQQFRTQTGMTVNHYLRQLRICHAQYLLQHTEMLISEVAMLCGFEDSNYFSVVFNREIGVTPGQWRQRSRVAA